MVHPCSLQIRNVPAGDFYRLSLAGFGVSAEGGRLAPVLGNILEQKVLLLVSVNGPRLVLRKPKTAPCPLVALTSDLFVGSGMRVRFTRDSGRAVSGFLLSGRWNRVQNLRFERMAAP